jgi:beta-glucanase (GH16 family)
VSTGRSTFSHARRCRASIRALRPLLVTLVAVHVHAQGDEAAHRYADEGYALVWSQEFDEPGRPDDSEWGYEKGFVRNQEAQWYQPENATVRHGCLVIEARREQVANPRYDTGSRDWRRMREFAEYTSSSLTTRGKRKWLYGRFEMRAKIDTRDGLWPAWWTLGSGETRRHWPVCGEIDIMEYYDGVLLANACWAKRGGQQNWDAVRKPLKELEDDRWSDKFHVWRMDWTEDSIMLYVDDRLLNTVALTRTLNPDGSNPFHESHYMIVNLAIGGTRGGDPSATEFPARYEIDYIRVYQKQP